MKRKKYIIIFGCLIFSMGLSIIGFNQYREQQEKMAEYEQIALEEQQAEKERRELERNSNFYEKLSHGFDTNILVIGNSMALSEGATNESDWINTLTKKIETNYESNVWYKNLACRYTGYDVGYTQIATLDDRRDYDAVIICYPACKDEIELTQYEAILSQVKKRYEKAAIIGIIANSDQKIDAANTIALVEHYEGICVNMQSIIDETNEDLIEHEFYPNDRGYELYAESVFNKIVDSVNEGKTITKEIQPLMESLNHYANCIYIPLRDCRKLSENTVVIDLEKFTGKICIMSKWNVGNKAYDIYYDYGNWLIRNEMNYTINCWYDSFMFHDVPKADNEIMIQFSGDAVLSEVKGFYLISENPIKLKE